MNQQIKSDIVDFLKSKGIESNTDVQFTRDSIKYNLNLLLEEYMNENDSVTVMKRNLIKWAMSRSGLIIIGTIIASLFFAIGLLF